jgi:hypothetical protein
LIVLGNAWESVDTFLGLEYCLKSIEDSSLMWLSHERVAELLKAGKKSFHPEMMNGLVYLSGAKSSTRYSQWFARSVAATTSTHQNNSLKPPYRQNLDSEGGGFDDPELTYKLLSKKYTELRRMAEERNAHRTAYMLSRLKAGRHPDTDPNFWNNYHEQPFNWKIKYPENWGDGAANSHQ